MIIIVVFDPASLDEAYISAKKRHLYNFTSFKRFQVEKRQYHVTVSIVKWVYFKIIMDLGATVLKIIIKCHVKESLYTDNVFKNSFLNFHINHVTVTYPKVPAIPIRCLFEKSSSTYCLRSLLVIFSVIMLSLESLGD